MVLESSADDMDHPGIAALAWILKVPMKRGAKLPPQGYGRECGIQHLLPHLPMYTLDNLIPDLERKLDVWTKIKSWLHDYGDMMALLCLIFLGIKFLTDLICIALTFLRVGPGAAIALIATYTCTTRTRTRS